MNSKYLCLWILLSICPLGCASALKLQITPSIDREVPPDPALAQKAQALPWEREYPVEVVFIEQQVRWVVDDDEVTIKPGDEARYAVIGYLSVSDPDASGGDELEEETRLALYQELRRAATVLGANIVKVTSHLTLTRGPTFGPKTTSQIVNGAAIVDRTKPIPKP